MKIAGMLKNTTSYGPGHRFVVFLQSCQHHCDGCQAAAQCHNSGVDFPEDELCSMMTSDPETAGLTICGGEPFAQAEECLALADAAHTAGLNVWCVTTETYEALLCGTDAQQALLRKTDVLIDSGAPAFQQAVPPALSLSKNAERIILVAESLTSGPGVLWKS